MTTIMGFSNKDLYLHGGFNYSVAAIVSTFFFLAFFVLYITRRADDPAGVLTARDGFRSRSAAGGLDPAVIAALPTFEYAAAMDLKIGKGALECAVCITEFDDDKETLRLLPGCYHVFHADCIDEWLRFHSTCPVCCADLTHTQRESTPASKNTDDRDSIVVNIPTDTVTATLPRPARTRLMRRTILLVNFRGLIRRSTHRYCRPGRAAKGSRCGCPSIQGRSC